MKILFTNDAPIIKYGLAKGFQKHGWDIFILTDKTLDGLIRAVDEFKPDYLLTEGGIDMQSRVFPVIVEKGIPHIYWGIEDPVFPHGLSTEWASYSELVLTPCIEMIGHYERMGKRVICVPFAIDPDMYKDYRGKSDYYKQFDAILVANNYNYYDSRLKAYRYLIQPFIDQGKNIRIYGMDWDNPEHQFHVDPKYIGGYMAQEESLIAYSNAKIVLGVHSIVDSKTMQSMRTFEILGCRGFFLSSYALSLEYMFKNHEHLVWSTCVEETIEYMNYYLAHDDARERIAENGFRFVHERHTYYHRVADIIRALKKEV